MRYFVVDTETASIKGPIIDLAVIEVDANLDIVKSYEMLIDPIVKIVPAAQAVHGISQSDVVDAPTMPELLERDGYPLPMDEPIIVIAHKAEFDCLMLAKEGILPEGYKRACTLKIARKMWPNLNPDEENHKLGTLAIMFGLESGPAHRAMGDAVTLLNLLRYMAKASAAESLDQLLSLGCREYSQDDKLNFGAKHKDDKIKDVPKSYIDWMFKNVTDLDPDLRVALEVRYARK